MNSILFTFMQPIGKEYEESSDMGNIIQLLAKGNPMDDAESMQTQGAPPSPSPSVGDTTNRMVWVSTGLIVGAILLAILGVMSDSWVVQEESETVELFGTEITTNMSQESGLRDFSRTVCINEECITVDDDLSSAYDNCTSDASDFDYNSSETEEICGDLGKTASAGFTGMSIISIGILVMLATLVILFMEYRGTIIPYSQYYPFVGAGFILLGVVVWYAMLPEGDASLGSSAWLTIASIILAAAAGGYSIYYGENGQSLLNNRRLPGIGVRALAAESDAREFVLRENAKGTKSTSLVEQGKVLRLVSTKLDNENVVTEDHFIVQKAALTGFTHYRYDWLDNGKYMWWLMTAFGIISLFKDSQQSPLLLVGALLSLAQLFDPELLSFETNSRRHRLLLYRQDSNWELTNFSMDEIDFNMQQLLSGGQLDGSRVEVKAAEIEENRAAEIKAEQEAAAALELAKVSAATPPVIAPIIAPIAMHGIKPTQPPAPVVGPIIAGPEFEIPPPPAPTGVQPLPPPLPLPPQAQPLPPLSLLDEPLPPPPPISWGD
jgi:hypothetical protein